MQMSFAAPGIGTSVGLQCCLVMTKIKRLGRFPQDMITDDIHSSCYIRCEYVPKYESSLSREWFLW